MAFRASARSVRLPCRADLGGRQAGGSKRPNRPPPPSKAARSQEASVSEQRPGKNPLVKEADAAPAAIVERSRLEQLFQDSAQYSDRGELVRAEASTAPQGGQPTESFLGGLIKVSPRVKGLFLLNVLTFLYGSNIPMVKDAQEHAHFGPWLFNAIRFGIAALVFTPWLPKALANKQLARNAVELGIVAAGAYGTQAYGLLTTEASRCSFLASFTVILVPLLAGLDGKHVSGRTWLSTAVAFTGVAVLELLGGHAGPEGFTATVTVGDAASLLSAALFSLLLYRTEALSSSLRGEGNSTLITSIQLSTLAVFFAIAAACEAAASGGLASAGSPSLADTTAFLQALPWRDILWTGLISTAGTLWIEVEALRSVSSTDAALVYTTEPVWGAVLSWAILGEVMTGGSYAGAALILCGSLIGQTGDNSGHGGPGPEEGQQEAPQKAA